MKQKLTTRFTERFGLDHPIALAPMDKVAGGRLAAAVSAAGGLGLIGGGYGEAAWLDRAISQAGNQRVGVGFITWSVARQPELIEAALARAPAGLMVSFGDAEEMISAAKAADVPTLWQVQRLNQAEQALKAGVDVLVVQGQEAGGHGMDRGLTALLPAVRDRAGPEQIILAAGGIADGRGLAASLMLGADGVLMGTRFWASTEAEGSAAAKAALVASGGDETVRSKVFDVARGVDWPWHFTGRIVANDFLKRWHGNIDALKQESAAQQAIYEASDPDDFSTRVLIAGEALDLIASIETARDIVETTVSEAHALLCESSRYLAS
ncbi:NAD(P)H-dependent flavin oxidoreductase [Pelagibius marinus]|uniref:NAD(P)H-dependent flavin oxidoreductase n=1 Tax=Pelagibius marinus TaxID=2762760 RepID=UPI0018728011|nr:nitronate monooxygenase [Pelagibius marinus]